MVLESESMFAGGKDEWTGLEIAVIGMSCRFPNAQTIDKFWGVLKNGETAVSFFSDAELDESGVESGLRKDSNYVKARGILGNAEYFDASFFGYTPNEAKVMDPQVRVFHECAWEALEDAGYDPFSYKGPIGIYAGASPNLEWISKVYLAQEIELDQFSKSILCNKDFMSTQVSYRLNLRGPSITIATACSTSLTAIHMACQALLSGECNIAIGGGASITLPEKSGYLYEDGMIDSPDGFCRTFDAKAAGTVFSNGAGAVVLKTLEEALKDRDNIYAVIKGSAINNDGNLKIGYTAPSITGQAEVIRSALKASQINAESITYIEAHGTGTELGDPIEVEALSKAFGTEKKCYCGIGSVKTNIGHLDAAAGIAGFIKTALSLKNKLIPPSLNFQKPNPKIDFGNGPFYVNKKLAAWKSNDYPLRAGVSSFGVGGTNAHIILEEAPENREATGGREYKLILLSARSEAALAKATANLADYLNNNNNVSFDDVVYTLKVGRRVFEYKKMLVCTCAKEALAILTGKESGQAETFSSKERKRLVVFIFPGQGPEYINMGLDLYEKEPVFRNKMDKCFAILEKEMGYSPKVLLYPGVKGDNLDQAITQDLIAQPLVFIIGYSLAELMISWGITPQAMLGQGIGEYVAACIAGVFTLEDALKIIVHRGKLMRKMPSGAMVTSPAPEEFKEFIGRIEMKIPKIPCISNQSGKWITEVEALSAEYWVNRLQATGRFDEGLAVLLENEDAVFVATGAGHALSALVNQHPDRKPGQRVLSLLRSPLENVRDDYYLACQLGRLWLSGVGIDWGKYYLNEERYRLSLPTYPFERRKYGLAIDARDIINAARVEKDNGSTNVPNTGLNIAYLEYNVVVAEIIRIWKEYFGRDDIDLSEDFFDLGGDSLKATILLAKVNKCFKTDIILSDFFESSTIEHLSKLIVSTKAGHCESIRPVEKEDHYPLSPAQKRIYILDQLYDIGTSYNIPFALQIEGDMDLLKVENAFKLLIERHESLRTKFMMVDEEPVQIVCDEVEFKLEYLQIKTENVAEIMEKFIRPFDISSVPLFRACLIKMGPGKHILLFDIHHIIADAYSISIMVEEFSLLYQGQALPEIALQYKDFAVWKNDLEKTGVYKRYKDYWIDLLANALPVLNLPADFVKPQKMSFAGNSYFIKMNAEITRLLNEAARKYSVTMFMMILAIYYVFLAKISDREDIIVGTVTSGRTNNDVGNIIGIFINMLALRNYPAGNKKFSLFLGEVKRNTLEAFDRQECEFTSIVEELRLGTSNFDNPLFNVVFEWENVDYHHVEVEDLKITNYDFEHKIAQFDMNFIGAQIEKEIVIEIEYNTSLFTLQTIEKFADYFNRIAATIVKDFDVLLKDIDTFQKTVSPSTKRKEIEFKF
jgi:phthiocerol/phenolphthiocerol synthesis type-I polyketide synthase E